MLVGLHALLILNLFIHLLHIYAVCGLNSYLGFRFGFKINSRRDFTGSVAREQIYSTAFFHETVFWLNFIACVQNGQTASDHAKMSSNLDVARLIEVRFENFIYIYIYILNARIVHSCIS
jgi:hypothetical protein